MKHNKHKHPIQETTKDDSSDVERVKKDKPSPPPQPRTGRQSAGSEEEEAEKGHS